MCNINLTKPFNRMIYKMITIRMSQKDHVIFWRETKLNASKLSRFTTSHFSTNVVMKMKVRNEETAP